MSSARYRSWLREIETGSIYSLARYPSNFFRSHIAGPTVYRPMKTTERASSKWLPMDPPGAGVKAPQALAMSRMARATSSQSEISLAAVTAHHLRAPRWAGESNRCRIFFKFVSRSWGGSRRRGPPVRRGLTAHGSVSEEGLGRCRPATAGYRIGRAWSPSGSGQRPGHPRSPPVVNCWPTPTRKRPEFDPAAVFSTPLFLNNDQLDALESGSRSHAGGQLTGGPPGHGFLPSPGDDLAYWR